MMKFIFIAIVLFLAFQLNVILGCAAVAVALCFIIFWNIPFFYARSGNKAFNDNDQKKALYMYEKAYKTGRASADIMITYGILLLRNAKPQDAVTIFNLVVMDKSNKKEIKYKAKQYRSLAFYKLGNAEDAIEDAQEVFDNCKNTLGYSLLGYLKLATNSDIDETYAFCREAYDFNNDDRDICDNMAVAYLRKGEFEQAKKITDEMIEKFPTFTEAYYHGALVSYKMGNRKKALELINDIDEKCKRTYLTTVSEDEIENLKKELNGECTND